MASNIETQSAQTIGALIKMVKNLEKLEEQLREAGSVERLIVQKKKTVADLEAQEAGIADRLAAAQAECDAMRAQLLAEATDRAAAMDAATADAEAALKVLNADLADKSATRDAMVAEVDAIRRRFATADAPM